MKNYKSEPKLHKPVLKDEVIEALRVNELAHLKKQPAYIDATLGLGGHTQEILKRGGNVLGIEADKEILEVAKERLERALRSVRPSKLETCPSRLSRKAGSFKLVHGNFRDIDKIAQNTKFDEVDGIVFDLGVATPQLISPTRGFSFQRPETPLDMRIDVSTQKLTASDLLAVLSEKQLRDLFGMVLNRSQAQKIAAAIVKRRDVKPIKKVEDFLEIISRFKEKKEKLHPATKAFLALRMAVNSELENLKVALPKAFNLLVPGGRLAVISFHSGEDFIVKHFFKELAIKKEGRIISREPVRPTDIEIRDNPQARSAKMRLIEKI